jgi:hypothetical protein
MRVCEVEGCGRQHKCRGMCFKHYHRWRKRGTTDLPPPRMCSVEGCERKHDCKGFCVTHYQRWKRSGSTDSPFAMRRIGPGGYALLRVDGRYVYEHRVFMEEYIGRPLRPEESVHHINGVRDDNRLENLELWSKSHPSGQRVEDKLAWAREIVALYEVAA